MERWLQEIVVLFNTRGSSVASYSGLFFSRGFVVDGGFETKDRTLRQPSKMDVLVVHDGH